MPGADGASGDVEEGGVAAGAEDEDKPLLDKTGGASDQAGGDDDDDDDDEGKPSAEDDAGDAKAMINQFKELAGIGDLDDSAQWCVFGARGASVFSSWQNPYTAVDPLRLPLTYHDHNKGKVLKRGRLGISVEIVPGDEAEARPVGHGRSEPNTDLYLPPTTGRMEFSYNPLAICKELLGPETIVKLICCCMCVLSACS